MIRHEYTIRLNRPVEQVFAFLADIQNLRTWQSNLIKSETLTEGPLRTGSRFREVRLLQHKEAQIEGEITSFEPNCQLATKTLTQPEVTVSYSLVPEESGTRLSYQFAMRTAGLMRLLEPMILSSIRKQTESDFKKLKQLMES